MEKLKYLKIGLLLIISQSCSELLQTDEYHKLSSEQHFELKSNNEIILSQNEKSDTIINLGILNAEYEDELYTGIHCKGPYDYIEFERIYFSFKSDTSLIDDIEEIKNPKDYYGYCRTDIPSPEECIQFSFGFPKNTGQIKNAPVLTIKGVNYECTSLHENFATTNDNYETVYQFELDSIEFDGFGIIESIYMTKTDGLILIDIVNH